MCTLVVTGPLRVVCSRLLGRQDLHDAPRREVLVLVTIVVLLGAAFTDAIDVYSCSGRSSPVR